MPGLSSLRIAAVLFFLCVNVLAATNLKLSAVAKQSHLKRRTIDFEPSLQKQRVHYAADDFTGGYSPQLAASLLLEPKLPTLILEDVDDHIQSVSCSKTEMKIKFKMEPMMHSAMKSWSEHSELVFVTSRLGCATSGTHAAYIVTRPAANGSNRTISFEAEKTTLVQSCHRISVDMGHHVVSEIATNELRRRIAAPQSEDQSTTPVAAATSTSTDIQSATGSLTVSFDSASWPSPTTVPQSLMVSQDISFSHIDTTLIPPDSSIASLITTLIQIPDNVTLKCLNCTLGGSVSLQAGGFTVDTNSSGGFFTEFDQADVTKSFFESGFFQFNATDMSAMMSFELDFLPGFSISPFTARLPDIPLGAFEIQEVLTFGPVLQFEFPISFTLNSPITFQAGFTLDVPPDSNMVLNISDISSSYVQGFQDTKLTALPFNANAENPSLNFSAGFQPKIVIGAALFQDIGSGNGKKNDTRKPNKKIERDGFSPVSVSGGVGAYLDLPQYVTTISQVNHTNEHCDVSQTSSDLNPPFIHVQPSTNIGAGVLWDLEADVLEVTFQRDGAMQLYESSHPLPTECLQWDPTGKKLVAARATSSSTSAASSSATAGVQDKNAANLPLSPPGLKDSWLGAMVLLGMALFVL